MPVEKYSHCGWCGTAFAPDQPWPRICANCGQSSYRNPVPVAVLLLPVGDGLLLVRRNIPPKRGELALPGGYINYGETWQEGAVRELREETGIVVSASEVQLFDAASAPDGTVLIFGLALPRSADVLREVVANDETQECVIAEAATELAFSLHTRAMGTWFANRPTTSRVG